MLLTEQEIKQIGEGNTGSWQDDLMFARAIETLIEEKLKAQEPICYHYTVDCCGVPENMFGHPDGYYPEDAVPLHTHPDPRVAELETMKTYIDNVCTVLCGPYRWCDDATILRKIEQLLVDGNKLLGNK